jgi:hypothetical protein
VVGELCKYNTIHPSGRLAKGFERDSVVVNAFTDLIITTVQIISFQTSIVQIHSPSNKRFHAFITRLIVGASTSVRRETLLVTRLLIGTTGLGSTSGTLLDDVAFVDSILIIALYNCVRESPVLR